MSVGVKICGLTTEQAVAATVEGGARFAGFVFFPKSPRAVTARAAGSLRASLPKSVAAVAVTVDAEDQLVAQIMTETRPDYLQLHGAETPERVAAIRERFGVPVIKALPVSTAADLDAVPGYAAVADLLLFDAKPAPGNTALPGGNARVFDWALVKDLDPGRPWLLAGGLTPENLAQAIAASGARLVDVSSGVEVASGVKDPALIRQFLAVAKTL